MCLSTWDLRASQGLGHVLGAAGPLDGQGCMSPLAAVCTVAATAPGPSQVEQPCARHSAALSKHPRALPPSPPADLFGRPAQEAPEPGEPAQTSSRNSIPTALSQGCGVTRPRAGSNAPPRPWGVQVAPVCRCTSLEGWERGTGEGAQELHPRPGPRATACRPLLLAQAGGPELSFPGGQHMPISTTAPANHHVGMQRCNQCKPRLPPCVWPSTPLHSHHWCHPARGPPCCWGHCLPGSGFTGGQHGAGKWRSPLQSAAQVHVTPRPHPQVPALASGLTNAHRAPCTAGGMTNR